MIDHRSTPISFNGGNKNIRASRDHLHIHTRAENTKNPHSVHYMGSQQNFPSGNSKIKKTLETENNKHLNL